MKRSIDTELRDAAEALRLVVREAQRAAKSVERALDALIEAREHSMTQTKE